MRETLKPLFPVVTENDTAAIVPRCENLPRWHKPPGIRTETTAEEITAEGLQKCIVWDCGRHLEVKRLLVRPEWQGRGVGSTVMRALQARGKKIVLFPVSDDGRQDDLEKFYRRLGFVPDFHDPETFVWEP